MPSLTLSHQHASGYASYDKKLSPRSVVYVIKVIMERYLDGRDVGPRESLQEPNITNHIQPYLNSARTGVIQERPFGSQ